MNLKKFLINKDLSLLQCFKKLRSSGTKTLIIIDKDKKFLGTLSGGDIRKILLKGIKLKSKIEKLYKKKCFFFKEENFSIPKARNIFKKKKSI